jgi:hypothetical protein
MTALNQEAPPVEVKAQTNYFRFDPLPKSDTYLFTLVGFNYLESTPFNRTDEKTKQKTVEHGPGIEWFLGTMVKDKPYFIKTWPIYYSISDRANYTKWYKAFTGAAPTAKQRPSECLGKAVMVPVELVQKTSAKGTTYTAAKTGSPSPVPSMLEGSITPLSALKAAFEAALAKSSEKADKDDTGNAPF